MPKLRPGVEAAARLSKISDKSVWTSIEKQYDDMLGDKGGENLLALDKKCEEIGAKWRTQKTEAYCTCVDLYTIIEWKFATGKPRPLWKQIKSNSEENVHEFSKDAFRMLRNASPDDNEEELNKVIAGAFDHISKLKGIGPASASAILSLYRPDLIVFMYDEILDCFLGERKYTVAAYLKIHQFCRNIAKNLETNERITMRNIGKILWCAARLSICKDKVDLTWTQDTKTGTENRAKRNASSADDDKFGMKNSQKRNSEQNQELTIHDGESNIDMLQKSKESNSSIKRKKLSSTHRKKKDE
jgi:hypothetical protein